MIAKEKMELSRCYSGQKRENITTLLSYKIYSSLMKNELVSKIIAATVIVVVFGFLAFFYFQKLHNGAVAYPANQPGSSPAPASSGNITVFTPLANQRVSQDFQITGKARVLEDFVVVRVKSRLTGQ